MSTSDKTRTKLMDSMRKTKESASAQGTEQAGKAEQPTQAAAKPAPKSAPKSATAKKKTAQPSSGNYSSRGTSEASGYQTGGRIWPD
jgi:hypothetical protein